MPQCLRLKNEYIDNIHIMGFFFFFQFYCDIIYIEHCIKLRCRASLVAQWLRVCLPVQGTRVRALAWEDPTCRGATGPVSHNY